MADQNASGLVIPLVLSPEAKELLLLLREQKGSANVQLEVGTVERAKPEDQEEEQPRSRRGSRTAAKEEDEQPRSRRGSRNAAKEDDIESDELPRSRRGANKDDKKKEGPIEKIANRVLDFIAANPDKNGTRIQNLLSDYNIKKVTDLKEERDIEDFDADLAAYEKKFL